MVHGSAGVQHELPAGVRDPRFPGGAAKKPHPSRRPRRADLRFLRSLEGRRGRDGCAENLRVEAVVRPCGGGAGAQGVQDQFAEEVFGEGVFGLGAINLPERQRTSH